MTDMDARAYPRYCVQVDRNGHWCLHRGQKTMSEALACFRWAVTWYHSRYHPHAVRLVRYAADGTMDVLEEFTPRRK